MTDAKGVEAYPLKIVAQRWIREAKFVIGVEFVPDTLKRTISGECIKTMRTAGPKEARDAVFRMVLRWWKSSDYARERNRRNWRNRVKTRSLSTRMNEGEGE